jgi:hypothetical protein
MDEAPRYFMPIDRFGLRQSFAGARSPRLVCDQSFPGRNKALLEHFNETQVSDGLRERVRAYMQTYRLDLDDIAVLLRSDRQHIAAWFIGASPPPESVHTLLFSLGTPPNARPARSLQHMPAI